MIDALCGATVLAIVSNLIVYLFCRLVWGNWPSLREVWPIVAAIWLALCGMFVTSQLYAADLPDDPVQRVSCLLTNGAGCAKIRTVTRYEQDTIAYHKIKPFHGRPLCSARRVTAPVERLFVVIGIDAMQFICDNCGKSFSGQRHRQHKHKFCSQGCYGQSIAGPRKAKDKELLIRLYVKEGYSLLQVAEILGCSKRTVWKRLVEYGIPRGAPGCNNPGLPKWLSDERELKRLYWDVGWSLYDIAKMAACSVNSVKTQMEIAGIDRRDSKEIGQTQRGNRSVLWKENSTKDEHTRWISSWEGRNWRRNVKRNANRVCELCTEENANVEAHHIYPFADYPELRDCVDNGICVCTACHRRLHSNAGKQLFYQLQEERIGLLESCPQST